jgi:hypothetical protein
LNRSWLVLGERKSIKQTREETRLCRTCEFQEICTVFSYWILNIIIIIIIFFSSSSSINNLRMLVEGTPQNPKLKIRLIWVWGREEQEKARAQNQNSQLWIWIWIWIWIWTLNSELSWKEKVRLGNQWNELFQQINQTENKFSSVFEHKLI